MYKLSVPINSRTIKRKNREAFLEDLKKCGASRVILATGAYMIDEEKRKTLFADLQDNCRFFKENGLEVGAWLWTFMTIGDGGFQKMKSLEGAERDCCPLDENFRKFAGEYLTNIAECGVDMIMFDDDFRFGFKHGMYCVCEKHMDIIRQKLNENISVDEIRNKIFFGGKNKYRDAYLEANGESLILFAKEMRDYVDKVNADIRLGLCACMSTWDNDGVDAATLSRILAGNTEPFLRLIGAPYWANDKQWGNRLQNVIEIERMIRSWCGDGIEIMSEGDIYPRPRHKTPASYLELFDIAMRVDGTTDGILKYMEDYFSSTDYEKGYVKAHIRNMDLYEKVERIFSDKKACGIRVYEKMNKIADAVIPKEVEGTSNVENIFFSISGRMLSDGSIPSIYEGNGVCGISFGENIKMLTDEELKKGVIIDASASRILNAKGIDTGMLQCHEKVMTKEEYFPDYDEYVRGGFYAYKTELQENVIVKSSFICDDGEYPLSYYYENSQGHKFFVFTFDAYFNGEDIYRSYFRSRQISEVPEMFGQGKLPAYAYGHPDLYIMCKKNDQAMAVGLFNIFADMVYEPVIELDKVYENINFVNCNGELKGDKVYLSDMIPFGFAAFEVS